MDDKTIKALLFCFDKPPEEAIKYLKSQGITISWDWQSVLEAIRNHCFTVSKVTDIDLLQTIKDELQAAVEHGTTYEEFKHNLDKIFESKGYQTKPDGSAWRLDTIYRTNLQTTYMAGRYAKMNEVTDYFPNWEFVPVLDNRTTTICNSLNGVILPAIDDFWKKNYPPLHYNCRSRVRAISDFQLNKRNLQVSDSELYKDVKPADGFDNSPDKPWTPDLTKYSPDFKSALLQSLGK